MLTSITRAQIRRLPAADQDAMLELEARIGHHHSALGIVRLVGVVALVAAAVLLSADLADNDWRVVVPTAAGSAALIILAEAPARYIAARVPVGFFRIAGVPLTVLFALTRPITRLVPFSAESAFRMNIANGVPGLGALEEARRLQELLKPDAAEPQLAEDERRMIKAVVNLSEKAVKEVMVPRPDVAAISTEASIEDVARVLFESGHMRIPLYEGSLDNIIGVIYARDVLRAFETHDLGQDLRSLAREPYFVPETKKAQALLQEFLAQSIHFALVVDEYGGIEGVVTLEDLIEEIVGEIEQEYEPPEQAVNLLTKTEAITEGQVPLDEVNEALHTALVGDGFETIGGFVLHHLGRVPTIGDQVDAHGVLVEVLSMSGRRIKKLRLRKREVQEPQSSSPKKAGRGVGTRR